MAPPPPYDLKSLFADMAQFQQSMGEVQASLTNPEDKARLGELLEQLQKARTDAEEIVPGILQDKLDNAKAQLAELQDLQKEIDDKKAEVQAKIKADEEAEKAKEAPPAAKPEETPVPQAVAAKPGMKLPTLPGLPSLPSLPQVPVDPALGQNLRLEILKTYGGLITRGR